MDLDKKKCVPCEVGIDSISRHEATKLLFKVPGWELSDNSIERTFSFSDFKEAIKFVNKVANIAEIEGHHPDIAIHWNKVILKLWTHAINGLSENDFILAAKINSVMSSNWN